MIRLKIFTFPTPTQLGMSDSDYAMPSKLFNDYGRPSWETYYDHLKKNYPVKYFIVATLPEKIIYAWRYITRPFVKAVDWVLYHTTRRYHMLDLRQREESGNRYPYRYGYIDCDTRMEFAMFNILDSFVKNEIDQVYIPTPEDVEKDPALRGLRDTYCEILRLHAYYFRQRKFDLGREDAAFDEYHEAKKSKQDNAQALYDSWVALQNQNDKALDDALLSLVKHRGCLWS